MINLSKEQLDLLEKELGITEEQIEAMTKEQWKDVREKCFFLSIDELVDEDGEAIEEPTNPDRLDLLESIADTKYKQLKS